ncbi:hypothetical protein WICPIJ_006836 [Wickerhamomyces pijperi]|uniref:BHLH domain-containing protein n=1 Tax=Wickerhamomyces pijperi TaxID=599730 RepID=A0A9P8Q315_WICPI|nr:hypothetical protein WICPIJ_006836 [Wickerhamomyces pijperi]
MTPSKTKQLRHQGPIQTATSMSYPQANLFPAPKVASPLTTHTYTLIQQDEEEQQQPKIMTSTTTPQQPSTPPFLNIQSPDFRSYKAFLRSPNPMNSNSNALMLDSVGLNRAATGTPPASTQAGYQISFHDSPSTNLDNMDFEAAYALLTQAQSPPPPPQPMSSGLHYEHGFQSPRNNTFNLADLTHSNLNSSTAANNDLKEYLFLSNTPSPKIYTPKLSTPTFLKPLPLAPHGDSTGNADSLGIDSLLSMFPKGQTPTHSSNQVMDDQLLLTENETNALDMFLDSIIDEKKPPIQTDPFHEHSANYFDLSEILANRHTPVSHQQLHQHLSPQRTNHALPLNEIHPLLKGGLGVAVTPPPSSLDMKLENHFELPPVAMVTKSPVKPIQEQKAQEVADERSESNVSQSSTGIKKQRRKRKNLLTEDQKKKNHISSEQRRRQIIKETFDQLIRLLPESQVECKTKNAKKKKQMAKSDVLEVSVREIELLTKVNMEMRLALGMQ